MAAVQHQETPLRKSMLQKCRGELSGVVVWLFLVLRSHACLFTSGERATVSELPSGWIILGLASISEPIMVAEEMG